MAATIGTAYDRWVAHLEQVHGPASYAFKGGDTPVKTLSSLYVVGDTNNAAECFISAHGGTNEDSYYFDNDSFRVPAGTTMRCYQRHGSTLSFSTNAFRLTGGQPMSEPGWPARPASCCSASCGMAFMRSRLSECPGHDTWACCDHLRRTS